MLNISKFENWLKPSFFFLAILFFYMPILAYQFAYHNDYSILNYDKLNFFGHPETTHLFAIGRPILAVIFNLYASCINSMNSMHVAQFLSITSISLLATFCFLHFRKELNISEKNAMLLSLLIFFLPSMTINSFWISNYPSEIFPLFFVLLSYVLIQKNFKHQVIGFTLLLANFYIYPPACCFFVTLIFINFLFGSKNQEQDKLKNVFINTGLFLTASGIYFLSIKYLWKPYLINHNFLNNVWGPYFQAIDTQFPQYKIEIAYNVIEKIAQIKEYVRFVFSAWFPLFSFNVISFITGLSINVLLLSITKNSYLRKFNLEQKFLIGLFLFGLLVVLTALPILAGPADYKINYRVTFSTMALIPALMIFFIEKTDIKKSVYIFVLVTLVMLFSQYRIILAVDRSAAEYKVIHNSLQKNLTPKIKEIDIQRPIVKSANRTILPTDFSLNGIDIGPSMIIVALRELHKNPSEYKINYVDEKFKVKKKYAETHLLINKKSL